jgi:SAM-dependent methyltransferase
MDDILALYQRGGAYDRMFEGVEDVVFYRQHLPNYGNDCLEICCGTGRILLELTADGMEAHGLDYADTMLDEARKKAGARGLNPHLYKGDMRGFDLERTFSTVMIVSNALAHLYTLDDIQCHFASVRRHMRPGSKYIIDMFVPRLDFLLTASRQHIMDFVDPNDGQSVAVYQESHYNNASQIKLNRWFYLKDGKTERVEDLPMRMFFPQELDDLVQLSGFRIVEKLGNYTGVAFTDGSPHQIVICELA